MNMKKNVFIKSQEKYLIKRHYKRKMSKGRLFTLFYQCLKKNIAFRQNFQYRVSEFFAIITHSVITSIKNYHIFKTNCSNNSEFILTIFAIYIYKPHIYLLQ